MTADFSLVTHAAERHTDIFTAGSLGNRTGKRGLADAGRSDEAEDRALDLGRASLHREILDNALLDLFKTKVIVAKYAFGKVQVLLDLRLLAPRNGQQPVEIVADDRCFGRHRAHATQLLQLSLGLFAGFLGKLGLVDAFFEFSRFIATILAIAKLLLDRLHLLVEIVFALRLLHLALDAAADTLLNLKNRNFGFHEGKCLLEALAHREDRQHFLLLGNLDREMRGNRIGKLRIVVDLAGSANHFRRNLLVQLDVVFEVGNHRAGKRLDLDGIFFRLRQSRSIGLVIIFAVGKLGNLGARRAFDQHLDGAVRQLQELQYVGNRADFINRVRCRIVIGSVFLGGKQNLLVHAHHFLQRANGLFAADKKRNDHMRENDNVTQRQNGIEPVRTARFRTTQWGLLFSTRHNSSPFSGLST